MRQQTVDKGEQGVDRVPRRTAAAALVGKEGLFTQNQLVKLTKIEGCSGALQAAQMLERGGCGDLGEKLFQMRRGGRQAGGVQPEPVISSGALDAPAGVIDLAEDHTAGNAATGGELVRRAVLGSPEQDVSRGAPGDPGQKPPARRAEGQRDSALGAGAHQGGRGTGVGEGDNAAQGMERVAGGLLMLPAGDHIFAVQGQIDVLRGHEEGVQQLSHGVSSMARFR